MDIKYFLNPNKMIEQPLPLQYITKKKKKKSEHIYTISVT